MSLQLKGHHIPAGTDTAEDQVLMKWSIWNIRTLIAGVQKRRVILENNLGISETVKYMPVK